MAIVCGHIQYAKFYSFSNLSQILKAFLLKITVMLLKIDLNRLVLKSLFKECLKSLFFDEHDVFSECLRGVPSVCALIV